jgi:hypothetical protein
MAFDRSKYVNRVIKKESEEIKTITDENRGSGNDWVKALFINKLPDGDYIMNILPPHNPEIGYWQQVSTTTFNVMGEDKDGNKKEIIKSIFSGKVHSNTRKCIVESYINIAEQTIENEETDAVAKKDKIETLKGEPYSPNKKNPKYGIMPKSNYAYYVELTATNGGKLPDNDGVYRLMANWTVKNSIQETEVKNQETNQPINTDIFTDPTNGCTLILTVDSSKSGADKYGVTLRAKRVPVKDENYEIWDKQKSLENLYVDSYTTKDFELAIEGLENFDKKSGFGIFQTEAFLDVAEELSGIYPEYQSDVQKENAKNGEVDLPFGNPKIKEVEIPKDDLPFDVEDKPKANISDLKAKLAAIKKDK